MASTVNWTDLLAPGKPPLPPDVVLEPELLKKIGIDPDMSTEIHASLRRNGRKTVGNLLAIETKAETIEIVGDRVSGETIFAFIQEQKQKKAEERLTSAQGGKSTILSPPLQTHPNLRDISAFFREQLIAENSEDTDSLSKRLRRTPSSREDFVLKLAEDLSRDPYNRDEFVVRKEIQDVVDQILDFFADARTEKQARLLIGNKGCGKTTVGKIIVVLLACSGRVVLYRTQGLQAVVFPKEVTQEVNDLHPMFGDYMPDLRTGERVFEFLQELPAHKQIVAGLTDRVHFVYDIGDERDADVGMMHGNNKWLIISSPNAGKWQKFLSQARAIYEYIVLPTWTWNQVKSVKRDPSLTVRTVLDRFQRFGGGSLRHLLEVKQDPLYEQMVQLKSVQPEILRSIVLGRFEHLPYCVEKNGSRVNLDLVYRIEECSPSEAVIDTTRRDSREYKVVLASKFVIHALVVEHILQQRMEASVLLETVSSCSQLGTFAGRICEAVFHRCISSTLAAEGGNQHEFDIYRLEDDARTGGTRCKTFQVGQIEVFTSTSFHRLEIDKLYIPMIPNFKTIDSFSIVRRSFIESYFADHPGLENPSVRFFILFFQATISPEHVVDGPWLLELAKKISASFVPDRNAQGIASSFTDGASVVLPSALVFLTLEGGVRRRQVVTQSSKPRSATVKEIRDELERRSVACSKSWSKPQLVQKLEQLYTAPGYEGPRLLLSLPAVEPDEKTPVRQACPDQSIFGPQYAVVLRSSTVNLLRTLESKLNGNTKLEEREMCDLEMDENEDEEDA
jgi:ABC-type oligopeptide transport system ATPase subunit